MQTGTSFAVTAAPVDPTSTPAAPVVGIDLYVSTDDGPYVLSTTVSPSSPTAVFQGRQGSSYAFLSMARDAAGNSEVLSKGTSARTFVPDL